MIDFHFWPTPNGHKISIVLEEFGLDHTVKPINILKGEQHEPDLIPISPNNRVPAIVDHDGPEGERHEVFESGAILLYLCGKTGKRTRLAGHQIHHNWASLRNSLSCWQRTTSTMTCTDGSRAEVRCDVRPDPSTAAIAKAAGAPFAPDQRIRILRQA